ncbi:MAG: DNA topoisomerase IV subunit B [Pseudomonadota bacterium]
MSRSYDAADIEVLTGLDPVRRRPGMYTDTARPNHLAQEVIDNSVDEALSGFAKRIDVTLYKDGSLEVRDDGRGMPVDKHPVQKLPGVELILTQLHAGGKFSGKSYEYSGGLNGVGVSVVNALSKQLDVTVKRDGQEFSMGFKGGRKTRALKAVGKVGKANTGTILRFWPDASYFDSGQFHVPRLKHLLKAKAVLCPELTVNFHEEKSGEKITWHYAGGLADYLTEALDGVPFLPDPLFTGESSGETEAVEWAIGWLTDAGDTVTESYVNLIPTGQGGTHVNGLRSGLTEALREFCEFRSLTPRGVRIAPDDVWDRTAWVISVKLKEPQFAGQTKDRLTSRECAGFVSAVAKDAFSVWLNQHPEAGEAIGQLAIARAQQRQRASKKVVRKRVVAGPALPGKLADCSSQIPEMSELFLVEGDSAGGSAKQARDRETQAIMPLRGKILNTWEVDSSQVLASTEVHDITVALGVEPGSDDLSSLRYHKVCILADADSDGAHIATLLCALFVRHFRPLVQNGHVYVAMPPLFRIDVGKQVEYALDAAERDRIVDRIERNKTKGKVTITRFKGLGEMNPAQLRETTMAPDTRRLVRLTIEARDQTDKMLDMLLAKKRAADRKKWLQTKGNLADV